MLLRCKSIAPTVQNHSSDDTIAMLWGINGQKIKPEGVFFYPFERIFLSGMKEREVLIFCYLF